MQWWEYRTYQSCILCRCHNNVHLMTNMLKNVIFFKNVIQLAVFSSVFSLTSVSWWSTQTLSGNSSSPKWFLKSHWSSSSARRFQVNENKSGGQQRTQFILVFSYIHCLCILIFSFNWTKAFWPISLFKIYIVVNKRKELEILKFEFY